MGSLLEESRRFRLWQDAGAPDVLALGHGAEWESNYPHWEALYESVRQRLRATDILSESERFELLYVLARDNEDEQVADILAGAPAAVNQLIPAIFDYPDPDARWQFAIILPLALGVSAMGYLQRLLQDDNEYVRRRAHAAVDRLLGE
ncbi:hypothetical protein DMB66_32625 [Actinoplanes sp. ATCC 53533]|uniref:hypothetical protein n=1 Tax=Actinoplanes sp. ATCC 53533 TaxID=1288362 RepID=UPI000F7B9683|nr:hypothetical protein [Actinoplanes sp. ATCC 53533]RSM56881.1 hypothetical protein DMB66_32625 [Actinoplanes sp. ATCC 53533]